jgi:hypothetical protein
MTALRSPTEESPEPGPNSADQAIPLRPIPNLAAGAAGAHGSRHAGDRLLAVLVVILAFLAASFVARNSDLWFHLATGRLIAHGEFTFGTDPFAYTTEQVYWANHSWLFDLGSYVLYGLLGGAGLVVLKALLVAALAVLLLGMRRPGSPLLLPVIGTTLAILATSPRLHLQPACLSYLFLGLTLWLLWKQHGDNPVPAARYLLPIIFAAWVNVDEWFVLGPMLVALFWLGERLGHERRTPGWLVLVGLAACLLNPHTYRAFALPAELSPVAWTSGLAQDFRFLAQFASPWPEYLREALKLNVAAIAYLALLALGPASFVLHRPALQSWRLTVWLPFAALAAWQARTIPFFAVVAAPITALNLQDFAARAVENTGGRPRLRNLLVPLSYCLLVSGLLGLIGLAWLGWLAGLGRDDRHVAWDMQPEPSLQRAAEILHQWRQEKLLADGEAIFAVAPEISGYLAWFDPGEKQFFDHRYPLFAPVARDYETVCRALQPELVLRRSPSTPAERERGKSWRQVLRDHGVGVVVYYEREPQRLFGVLRRLARDPEHWTLLDVAGQALIVGWNEARSAGGFDRLAFDPDRLTFGLPFEHALPTAPDQGPEQLPEPGSWFDRLAPRASASTAWESAAATAYLYYFDDPEIAQRQRNQQWRNCFGPKYAASLAGLPALPPALFSTVFQLTSSRRLLFPEDTAPRFLSRGELGPYFAHLLDRSPALPLLAVRAARRAVAANPRDANAWLRLGQAYLLLRSFTVERSAEGLLPPLDQVRHVQIVTALEQAVRLNPDFEAAHHELAVLYGQRKYFDLALEHQREELRLAGLLDRRPGESADEFAVRSNRLKSLVNDIDKLTEQVRDSHEKYAVNSRALQGDRLAQADMALKLGLARQAVEEVLLVTPAEVLGAAGIKLELEMLLLVGRIDEVRSILGDPSLEASKHGLRQNELLAPQDGNGQPVYAVPYRWSAFEWLRVLQSAAVGDYAQACADLGAIRAELAGGRKRMQGRLTGFDDRVWQFLPGLLSGPPVAQAFTAYSLQQAVDEKGALEIGESALRAQQADLWVLEGLFVLEQGNTRAARSAFSEAMKLEAQPAAATVSFAGAPIATDYLSKLRVEY